MIQNINMAHITLLFVFVLLITFPTIISHADDGMFTEPVAHVSVDTNTMTPLQLKLIFTLSVPRWTDGSRVVVVVYPADHVNQKTFLKEYFGMNSFRFEELINSKVNTGRANPPIVVETERDMIRTVKGQPGSIGFTKSHVVIRGEYGIKRIKVN